MRVAVIVDSASGFNGTFRFFTAAVQHTGYVGVGRHSPPGRDVLPHKPLSGRGRFLPKATQQFLMIVSLSLLLCFCVQIHSPKIGKKEKLIGIHRAAQGHELGGSFLAAESMNLAHSRGSVE
jgi:hypothetical protein